MRIADLPLVRNLYEVLTLARRRTSMAEDFTARSDPQYAHRLINVLIDEYLERHLYQHPRYSDYQRLPRFEYQVFSQNGEDGIIDEIFKRIGTTNRTFVEFGVGDGLETNTTNLLVKGWRGGWIEADPDASQAIRRNFEHSLESRRLALQSAFITAENIERLIDTLSVPEDLDLLSIDIDGNDYWIWKAIVRYRPRVLMIEYNATFRPDTEWIKKYDPRSSWDRTTYFGASLKSLEILGRRKGYVLVGCGFIGVNAFFVRADLAKDLFAEPFTAENHYEPPRYQLWRKTGHPRGFGEFTTDH